MSTPSLWQAKHLSSNLTFCNGLIILRSARCTIFSSAVPFMRRLLRLMSSLRAGSFRFALDASDVARTATSATISGDCRFSSAVWERVLGPWRRLELSSCQTEYTIRCGRESTGKRKYTGQSLILTSSSADAGSAGIFVSSTWWTLSWSSFTFSKRSCRTEASYSLFAISYWGTEKER